MVKMINNPIQVKKLNRREGQKERENKNNFQMQKVIELISHHFQ
jgi:hypothetical protein